MRDEALAELIITLSVAHENLVPAEAGSDQTVGDVEDCQVCLGPGCAVADQERLQVGRDWPETVKLGHLPAWPGTLGAGGPAGADRGRMVLGGDDLGVKLRDNYLYMLSVAVLPF